jgi:hypothetical protein
MELELKENELLEAKQMCSLLIQARESLVFQKEFMLWLLRFYEDDSPTAREYVLKILHSKQQPTTMMSSLSLRRRNLLRTFRIGGWTVIAALRFASIITP